MTVLDGGVACGFFHSKAVCRCCTKERLHNPEASSNLEGREYGTENIHDQKVGSV